MPKSKPETLYKHEIRTDKTWHLVQLTLVDNIYTLTIHNNGIDITAVLVDHNMPIEPIRHARQQG